ncbi:MAG: rhodanese-like domain-containing protein [Gammaproteobacteria bacterium]|nr:rhodanese-like domain-containing protein [Gammaproteobacteria bacterium]MDH5801102.1 rhodanese-like domain-containing protein [Gammaproteobacteria bacterium]
MYRLALLLLVSLLASSFVYAAEDFPGRTHNKYKNVPYIELNDLHSRLANVTIVDVRSAFEFNTLKIKSAINIPVAFDTFEDEVKKLHAKTKKTLVFYCNGHTCMKSYAAAQRAKEAGLDDVLAFDAGIFDWTKAHPDQAVLLGQSPVNIGDLIPKKKLKARMLDPDKFSDMATQDQSKTLVIDIRDKFQRAGVGFFPGMERWTSLNDMDKLYMHVKKAAAKNKTIYIYDEVGKQVRWLQYALERLGVKNYYFMSDGARGYYKMIAKAP